MHADNAGRGKNPKTASLMHERQYLAFGCENIVGIDEAGRGTWAGPVVAAAVCLPVRDDKAIAQLQGVRDSKQMSSRQRLALVETVKSVAIGWGIGNATNAEIDANGIVPATKQAMARALDMLIANTPDFAPDCLFLDSMPWPEAPVTCRLVSIVKGDQHSLSIAAASVLAKVWRDQHMYELDNTYPVYGFAQHKGYGTPAHRAALKTHGASPVHRQSYAPIRALKE